MNVFINLVVFSTQSKNTKCVLSTSEDYIKLPRLAVNDDNKNDIEYHIGNYLRENYIMVTDLDLMPQFIQFHSNFIPPKEKNIEMIYCSVVDATVQKSEKCWWKSFDCLLDENKEQSALLMECIRRLV